jgi:hypothetical protein
MNRPFPGAAQFETPTYRRFCSARPHTAMTTNPFRVRGRFVFNQPIEEALDEKIIRRPIFRPLDPPIPASGNRQSEVVELKSAGPESEDTARITPLSPRDMADAAQFVQCLVPAVAALPAFAGVDHPKIIVRADDNAKLELLQGEIERVAGARALLIHHAQQRNDDGLCAITA